MKLFIIIIIHFTLFTLSGLDISLADLNPLHVPGEDRTFDKLPDFQARLIQSIEKNDFIHTLQLSPLDLGTSIRSLLDAGRFCSERRVDYLLYGTIFGDSNWSEIRISLYERETDRIRTLFYGKADSTRYDDLIAELGGKICRYFYKTYHIEPALIQTSWKSFGKIGISGGYWGIFPHWNESLAGAFSLAVKGSLAPDKPVFHRGDFTFFPGFGLSLNYSLGFNRPGYEDFFYHSWQISFPLEFNAQWRDRHCFSFTASAGNQIDFLLQSRLYGETYEAFSQTLLLKFGLSYALLMPPANWFLELSQGLDVSFYEPPMISYQPSLSLGYRFYFNK